MQKPPMPVQRDQRIGLEVTYRSGRTQESPHFPGIPSDTERDDFVARELALWVSVSTHWIALPALTVDFPVPMVSLLLSVVTN